MEIKKITEDNFQTEVMRAETPVFLEFYADWCNPCKAQLPILEQAAEEANDVKFYKINVDEEPKLCEKYGVFSVPTMFILKEGEIFRKIEGVHSLEAILEYLEM